MSPAEPPKVGIKAPAALATPTISTATSVASTLPERKVSDAITVGDTEELNGTIAWNLLGPVTPVGGSCEGLNWDGAATADQGTIPIAGAPATYDTAETTLNAHGCYGYEATVEGPGFEPETSPVGSSGETVLVFPAGPAVQTTVSADSVLPGTPFADSITVSGTEGFPGNVSWKLLGPVAPVNGACEAVEWAGAPIADEGEYATVGDGTEATPPESLTEEGCYGYEATLEGEHLDHRHQPDRQSRRDRVGAPGDPDPGTRGCRATRCCPAAWSPTRSPWPGPKASPGRSAGGSSARSRPATDGSCTGLEWGAAEGRRLRHDRDRRRRDRPDGADELTEEGCYGYQASVVGEHLVPFTSPFGSAGETVLVHPAKPTLATLASADSDAPGAQASDQITVAGTEGFAGTVHWKLAGPVTPAADGSCAGARLGLGAAPSPQGDLPVTGDGQAKTPGRHARRGGLLRLRSDARRDAPDQGDQPARQRRRDGPDQGTGPGAARRPREQAGQGDLTIVKRVDQSSVEVGKPLHYTIEVNNKGKAPATDTVVTDTPRSPLAFVSAKSSAGTCGDAFPLVCKLGTLEAGGEGDGRSRRQADRPAGRS